MAAKLKLDVPPNVDIKTDVSINASWQQRIIITYKLGPEAEYSVWEGQGEGQIPEGPIRGKRIIRSPQGQIYIEIYHSGDGRGWFPSDIRIKMPTMSPTPTPVPTTSPWWKAVPADISVVIESEDGGGDHDYNDAVITFSWSGFVVGVLAVENSITREHIRPQFSVGASALVSCEHATSGKRLPSEPDPSLGVALLATGGGLSLVPGQPPAVITLSQSISFVALGVEPLMCRGRIVHAL